jgi:hypothetical protein
MLRNSASDQAAREISFEIARRKNYAPAQVEQPWTFFGTMQSYRRGTSLVEINVQPSLIFCRKLTGLRSFMGETVKI